MDSEDSGDREEGGIREGGLVKEREHVREKVSGRCGNGEGTHTHRC